MKRNYTLQNPKNRVTKLMENNENRSLYIRLGQIKSSIDNKPPQRNIHLYLRSKERQAKNQEIKTINQSNEILLDRMFSIFTRKRPRQKGFDCNGKPFIRSEHDLKTLNFQIRKNDNEKITTQNSTMLIKLQQAQPRILNQNQWKQHLENYSSMKRMIRYYGTNSNEKYTQNGEQQKRSSKIMSSYGSRQSDLNKSAYATQSQGMLGSFYNDPQKAHLNRSRYGHTLSTAIPMKRRAQFSFQNRSFSTEGGLNTQDNTYLDRPQTAYINTFKNGGIDNSNNQTGSSNFNNRTLEFADNQPLYGQDDDEINAATIELK